MTQFGAIQGDSVLTSTRKQASSKAQLFLPLWRQHPTTGNYRVSTSAQCQQPSIAYQQPEVCQQFLLD